MFQKILVYVYGIGVLLLLCFVSYQLHQIIENTSHCGGDMECCSEMEMDSNDMNSDSTHHMHSDSAHNHTH